jgi:hypothetical protein
MAPNLPCQGRSRAPAYASKTNNDFCMKFSGLFSTLKGLRKFEKLHLPFLKSYIDFDIVIEVGYAQERKKNFTPKQLFLLDIGSTTTVRRRLVILTERGVIRRRTNKRDHRSDVLTISPSALRALEKYGIVLSGFAELITSVSAGAA